MFRIPRRPTRPPRSRAPPDTVYIRKLVLTIRYHLGDPMSKATLSWTLPIDRTDNTPLPEGEISSVDVYDDTGDGPLPIANLPGPATEFDTDVLAVGNHAFTVYVNDNTGHSSAASNIAVVTVPATQPAPNAVTDLAATLVP